MGQNRWYPSGVGAPPILVDFSGDWHVHRKVRDFDPWPLNEAKWKPEVARETTTRKFQQPFGQAVGSQLVQGANAVALPAQASGLATALRHVQRSPGLSSCVLGRLLPSIGSDVATWMLGLEVFATSSQLFEGERTCPFQRLWSGRGIPVRTLLIEHHAAHVPDQFFFAGFKLPFLPHLLHD